MGWLFAIYMAFGFAHTLVAYNGELPQTEHYEQRPLKWAGVVLVASVLWPVIFLATVFESAEAREAADHPND